MFWSSMSQSEWTTFLASKSKDQREKFLYHAFTVLRLGNRIAKSYAEKIFDAHCSLDKFQKAYPKLLKMRKSPKFDIQEAASALKLSLDQVLQLLEIPEEEQVLIEAWHQLCVMLSSQYEPLLIRLSKKYQRYRPSRSHHIDDYLESFGELMVSAVRSYDDPNVKFITFVWQVAKRAVHRSILKSEGRSERNTRLETIFHKKQQELIASGKRVTFDDVVQELNLDEHQLKFLMASLNYNVLNEQDLPTSLDKILFQKQQQKDHLFDIMEVIEEVSMSALERDAFKAQGDVREHFTGENLVDVAKKHSVTHQAVSCAVVRANDKLRQRLQRYYSCAQ